jgi:hypothetical protein
MQHFGQETFCVHGDALFEEVTAQLLHRLYADRDEIRVQLRNRGAGLRDAHAEYTRTLFAGLP